MGYGSEISGAPSRVRRSLLPESSPSPIDPITAVAMLETEVPAPLPESYREAQKSALLAYWEMMTVVAAAAEVAKLLSKHGMPPIVSEATPQYMPTVNAP